MKLDKEELDTLRLFLSSLFARRQRYLWINTKDPLTVYFSTIGPLMPLGKKTGNKTPPYGPAYIYKPTVDDFVHKVTFKDDKFISTLMKALPICTLGNSCIDIPLFSSIVNKGLLDALVYNNGETEVLFKREVKNKAPEMVTVLTKVGDHLFGVIANYYALFERNVLRNENVCIVPGEDVMKIGGRLSYIEIDFRKLPKIKSDYLLKIPVYEGLTSICKSEYTKKSKLIGTTNMALAPNKKAVGLVITYEDDFVKVESVQPVSLWFPKFA